MKTIDEGFRTAIVLVQGREAGILTESDEGYSFQYLLDYLAGDGAIAVSLTLPLSEKVYESKTLFAFFDGLIPEGWLLNIAHKHWNIPEKDRFGVLLRACRDCIGDVQIMEVTR